MEDGGEQRFHEIEQVRHRNVAVDHHAFELIEGVLVGRIHALVAEHAAGRDHAQRQPQPFHAAHLHRRSVGAQQVAAFEPKRVLHVARGMLRGNVQGIEVVILVFHLRPVQHGETERSKQLFELPLDARDGVQVAAPRRRSGQGQVEPFSRQTRAGGGPVELAFAEIEFGFQLPLGAVQNLPKGGTLGRRQLADFLLRQGERAFAAEHLYPHRFQLFLGAGRVYPRQGTGFQFLYGISQHEREASL